MQIARPICKNQTKDKVYFKLPPDVKDARFQGKVALTYGSNLISRLRVMSIMFIVANARSTGISYASF